MRSRFTAFGFGKSLVRHIVRLADHRSNLCLWKTPCPREKVKAQTSPRVAGSVGIQHSRRRTGDWVVPKARKRGQRSPVKSMRARHTRKPRPLKHVYSKAPGEPKSKSCITYLAAPPNRS